MHNEHKLAAIVSGIVGIVGLSSYLALSKADLQHSQHPNRINAASKTLDAIVSHERLVLCNASAQGEKSKEEKNEKTKDSRDKYMDFFRDKIQVKITKELLPVKSGDVIIGNYEVPKLESIANISDKIPDTKIQLIINYPPEDYGLKRNYKTTAMNFSYTKYDEGAASYTTSVRISLANALADIITEAEGKKAHTVYAMPWTRYKTIGLTDKISFRETLEVQYWIDSAHRLPKGTLMTSLSRIKTG